MGTRVRSGLILGAAVMLAACSAGTGSTSAEPPASAEASTGASASPAEVPEQTFVAFVGAEPGSGDGITIGYINAGDSSPYWAKVSDSMAEQAGIAGAELINCDTNFDSAKALECARSFKTQGVDVIISSNIDSKTAPEICNAGPDVPVLATWIKQEPCETAFFGSDDTAAGMVFGTALGEFFKSKFNCEYDALISLEQVAAGEANTNRMGGARQGFEEVCGPTTNFKSYDTGGTLDGSQTIFADVLTAMTGANKIGILCLNDESCLGALAAARTAGREKDIYIASAGADEPSWCEILTNPNWVGGVAYLPEQQGKITIPAAISLAKGVVPARNILMKQDFVNGENIKTYFPVEEASC